MSVSILVRLGVMRINRNIVECKDVQQLRNLHLLQVLIETLWNVKSLLQPIAQSHAFGINRNIVECKVCSKCQTCS